MQSLVIGVDAGATSTRVAVHTLDGARVGYARAGAGNPSAHGLATAVSAIETALGQALGSLDGSRVVASLAGVAGHVEEMVPALAKVWAGHDITVEPRYMGDVTIAYAAGSPEPDGSLLLSGTGAVAARIAGFELGAVADGLGWLLGDAGSGFWIGREAARAVVHAFDRGLPVAALDRTTPDRAPASGTGADRDPASEAAGSGLLVALIGDHFLGDERPATPRAVANRIVRLAQADHMRLAKLSALVSRAASEGDPLAAGIVREAAGHLVATLRRVHTAGPVVLAGSVLTSPGPVRQAVTELLAGERVTTAGDAASAAAWLAARDHLSEPDTTTLHAAFTSTA
ncbi:MULTISPECIES: N-acetylglucosamine kinase [unclassified Nonomuraea]|uniref:N-acetylglucosamine kinase n=1 Tax=unclassified Nonomuraea TaxID=2593643 RepID=UPI001F2A85F5|nr:MULTISPECIES: BadF/BadG/BcrA/BcrD ATPase family protein [unclassified Nonomuraea]